MSKTYRVAAIGAGFASVSPLPTLRDYPNVELVAICTRNQASAEKACELFGGKPYTDIHAMLANESIDIVYIATPVINHVEAVMAAINAGKHVLCEKPLALTAAEAKQLRDAAQAKGVVNKVAFNMRFFAAAHTIEEQIRAGTLGDLRHASINLWVSQPESTQKPWGWFNDAEQGGGVLLALGSHYIDLIRHWCGEIKSVSAFLRTWVPELADVNGVVHPVTSDDGMALMLELVNGAVVQIHISGQIKAGTGARVELYGTQGSIVQDGMAAIKIATPEDKMLRDIPLQPIAYSDVVKQAAGEPGMVHGYRLGFAYAFEQLIEAIEGRPSAGADFNDGYQCNLVLDAIKTASRERRVIVL
jgi:predicted dehydrogenase